MTTPQDVVVVVLAAGLSRRYGEGDKLLHVLRGQPLCLHIAGTLSALPFRRQLAVCSNSQVAHLFAEKGFEVVHNIDPQAGLGSSLHAAMRVMDDATSVLVCLADMPFVSAAHLEALVKAFNPEETTAVASSAAAYLGPPAIFSAALLHSLPSTGESGARALLRGATLVSASPAELTDFDTRAAFEADGDNGAAYDLRA